MSYDERFARSVGIDLRDPERGLFEENQALRFEVGVLREDRHALRRRVARLEGELRGRRVTGRRERAEQVSKYVALLVLWPLAVAFAVLLVIG